MLTIDQQAVVYFGAIAMDSLKRVPPGYAVNMESFMKYARDYHCINSPKEYDYIYSGVIWLVKNGCIVKVGDDAYVAKDTHEKYIAAKPKPSIQNVYWTPRAMATTGPRIVMPGPRIVMPGPRIVMPGPSNIAATGPSSRATFPQLKIMPRPSIMPLNIDKPETMPRPSTSKMGAPSKNATANASTTFGDELRAFFEFAESSASTSQMGGLSKIVMNRCEMPTSNVTAPSASATNEPKSLAKTENHDVGPSTITAPSASATDEPKSLAKTENYDVGSTTTITAPSASATDEPKSLAKIENYDVGSSTITAPSASATDEPKTIAKSEPLNNAEPAPFTIKVNPKDFVFGRVCEMVVESMGLLQIGGRPITIERIFKRVQHYNKNILYWDVIGAISELKGVGIIKAGRQLGSLRLVNVNQNQRQDVDVSQAGSKSLTFSVKRTVGSGDSKMPLRCGEKILRPPTVYHDIVLEVFRQLREDQPITFKVLIKQAEKLNGGPLDLKMLVQSLNDVIEFRILRRVGAEHFMETSIYYKQQSAYANFDDDNLSDVPKNTPVTIPRNGAPPVPIPSLKENLPLFIGDNVYEYGLVVLEAMRENEYMPIHVKQILSYAKKIGVFNNLSDFWGMIDAIEDLQKLCMIVPTALDTYMHILAYRKLANYAIDEAAKMKEARAAQEPENY